MDSSDESLAADAGTPEPEATQTRQSIDRSRSVANREAPDLRVGDSVGRYVLLRPVAAGGMGMVYVAFDPELDRNVALKLLLPSRRKAKRKDSQARLIAEAQSLARLSHPNVVVVYDVGTWRDRVYVALEYVEGKTLDHWLRAQSRTWREVVEAMLQAGRGLAAAHAAAVIHHDFKPANVLVGDDGVVRVLDFGLARRAESGSSRSASTDDVLVSMSGVHLASEPGVVVGTPGYIAPEQYLGAGTDPRSDQFSFAVTLWEALFRGRPFVGRRRRDVREAVISGKMVDPPRDVRVPTWLMRLVRRGLSRDPQERFADMNTLLDALDRGARRGRKRGVAIAAGVAAIGFGGYAQYYVSTTRSARCKAGQERVGEVWGQGRRAEIEEAFGNTGKSYAPSAWTGAQRVLDRYADAWLVMYVDACEATRFRGEQSDELLDRRMLCLSDRLEGFRALGDVFAAADAGVVERAIAAASALEPLGPCADAAQLMAGHAVSAEPTARARTQEVGELLAQASAMQLAVRGRSGYSRGLERAREALERAREYELGAYEARAQLLIGRYLDRMGDVPGAEAAFDQAVWAADAARADDVRARALIRLAYVVGHLRGDVERGGLSVRLARRVLERIALPEGDPLWAKLLNAEAILLTHKAHYDEALRTYEKALAILENAMDADVVELTTTIANLGSAHLGRGDYERAKVQYERALKMREDLLGPDHPMVGEVLGSIGNVLHAQGESEEALTYLQRAVGIIEEARGKGDASVRVFENNIGVALQSLERYEAAERHFARAAEAWRAIDPEHPMLGAVMANAAEVQMLRERTQSSIATFEQALEILQGAYKQPHPYVAHAHSGLGRAHLEAGNGAAAREHLTKAVDLFEAVQAEPQAGAEAQFALARALKDGGAAPSRARKLAAKAATTYRALGDRFEGELAEIESWLEGRSK